MARAGGSLSLLAVVALVLCCGAPFLAVAAAGALGAVVGAALRHWPLTALALAALLWAVLGAARLARARSRAGQGGRRDRDTLA